MEPEFIQMLGVACKYRVLELIERELPGNSGVQIFWNGNQYSLIFQSKEDYKWAKKHHTQLLHQIKQFFAESDVNRHGEDYPIELTFGYGDKMNLYHHVSEDLGNPLPENTYNVPDINSLRWRIAPWIAFSLGILWMFSVWASKKGNAGWRDFYPAISLIAAGFVLKWTWQWINSPPDNTVDSDEDRFRE